MAERIGVIYERTIDYGAHPNEGSVFGSLLPREGNDTPGFDMHYVAPDELSYRFAFRTCTQAGLLILDLVAAVFPVRAKEVDLLAHTEPIKLGF